MRVYALMTCGTSASPYSWPGKSMVDSEDSTLSAKKEEGEKTKRGKEEECVRISVGLGLDFLEFLLLKLRFRLGLRLGLGLKF